MQPLEKFDIAKIRELNKDRTPLERERAKLKVAQEVERAIYELWKHETDPLKLEILTETHDNAVAGVYWQEREVISLETQ